MDWVLKKNISDGSRMDRELVLASYFQSINQVLSGIITLLMLNTAVTAMTMRGVDMNVSISNIDCLVIFFLSRGNSALVEC